MATYLHQIIAVRPGAEADAKAALDQAKTILSVGGDRNPLTGLVRTHEPKADGSFDKVPEQRRNVQLTTAGLIGHVTAARARLMDIQLTRERGNAAARAAVVLDGEEILPPVPAGFLLFLEAELRTLDEQLVARLQALDPAEEWTSWQEDTTLQHGVYRAAARQRLSTTKRAVCHVGVEPTEHQPAVVQWRDEDVTTGTLTFTEFSGQLPASRIEEIRGRLSQLLAAVRQAREEANRLEVQPADGDGRNILQAVFGDLLA